MVTAAERPLESDRDARYCIRQAGMGERRCALNQAFTLELDGRPVRYDWVEADELVHAFAISVHKSQGNEFPAVVLPMMTQHYLMLQRNLLYTAVTRAKGLVVLVGQRRAIAIAVRNNRVALRYSGLSVRLGL